MRADTALQFAQVQKHHLERHCGDQKRPQGRFFVYRKVLRKESILLGEKRIGKLLGEGWRYETIGFSQ